MKPTDRIEDIDCSNRLRSCCKANGIETLTQLKEMLPLLPKLRNFNKGSISEAKEIIYEIERRKQ